jgi:hypothetical protein
MSVICEIVALFTVKAYKIGSTEIFFSAAFLGGANVENMSPHVSCIHMKPVA